MYDNSLISKKLIKKDKDYHGEYWIYEIDITFKSGEKLIPAFTDQLIYIIKKNIRFYDLVFENEGKVYVILESIKRVEHAEGVLKRLKKILKENYPDTIFIKSSQISIEDIGLEIITGIAEFKKRSTEFS